MPRFGACFAKATATADARTTARIIFLGVGGASAASVTGGDISGVAARGVAPLRLCSSGQQEAGKKGCLAAQR